MLFIFIIAAKSLKARLRWTMVDLICINALSGQPCCLAEGNLYDILSERTLGSHYTNAPEYLLRQCCRFSLVRRAYWLLDTAFPEKFQRQMSCLESN